MCSRERASRSRSTPTGAPRSSGRSGWQNQVTSSSSPARATSRARRSAEPAFPSTTARSPEQRSPRSRPPARRAVIPISWEEVEGLALGWLESDEPGRVIARVVADSRDASEGDLFVALNTGTQYVDDARARGA